MADNKGDFNKLYRNIDIVFEITFIIGFCAIPDVAKSLTALGSIHSLRAVSLLSHLIGQIAGRDQSVEGCAGRVWECRG